MKKIGRILDKTRIINLKSETKNDVIHEMCALVSNSPHVKDASALFNAIQSRETVMSTGIGMGIAIPHAKIATVTDMVMAVGNSSAGVDYQSLDDQPVHKIILIVASDTQGEEFLKILGRLGAFLNDPDNRKQFLKEQDPQMIMELLRHIDGQ